MTEDCGFKITKVGGLFCKKTREGVLAISGRRSRDGRFGLDVGGKGEPVARVGEDAAVPPLPWRRARRSCPIELYGARFAEQRTPGERGDKGELTKMRFAAGERTKGHPPWPAIEKLIGVHGTGAMVHGSTNREHREREGSERVLTAGKNGAETARRRLSARRGGQRSLETSGGGSLGHSDARGSGETRQLMRGRPRLPFLKRQGRGEDAPTTRKVGAGRSWRLPS
jgi:hypothetical protein